MSRKAGALVVASAALLVLAGVIELGGLGSPAARTWVFLGGASLTEATLVVWVLWGGVRWARDEGETPSRAREIASWCLVTIVVVGDAALLLRDPTIREQALRWSALKSLVLFAAPMAGVVEELVFRRWIMDALARRGVGALGQVCSSGLAFGLVHATWGAPRGDLHEALIATAATTLLGALLAVVYLVGGRRLAPCVVGHTMLDLVIEPGLFLRAMGG